MSNAARSLRRLRSTCLTALCCTPFLLATAHAQVTYSYTGISLGTSGIYTTDTRINATFTVANPLPPDSTTDVTGSMTSYTFTDGVQTLTEANSIFFEASVTTDSVGVPRDWRLLVYATPLPDMVGEPVSAIWFLYTSSNNSIFESAFVGIPCDVVEDGVCRFSSPGAIGNLEDGVSSGLIVLGGPPPPWGVSGSAAIPTLGRISSVLLMGTLGMLGLLVLRRLS